MGRLTAQVLSDSHSHRLIDGSLAWIASDYLLSWCEIDTILISQTKQTFSFKVCQKVVRLFWKLLLIDVTSVVFYNALIYDIVPGLSQYLVQINAHTLIPRYCSTLWWHHEWGIPGDKLLMKEMSIYKRWIDVNESLNFKSPSPLILYLIIHLCDLMWIMNKMNTDIAVRDTDLIMETKKIATWLFWGRVKDQATEWVWVEDHESCIIAPLHNVVT